MQNKHLLSFNNSRIWGKYLVKVKSIEAPFSCWPFEGGGSVVTCVALAKAGLVVGPLRSSILLGCLVCKICNSKGFHSFLFKHCIMIVRVLKMCTSYFVHISWLCLIFERC